MNIILIAKDWKDYEILDAGDGQKLERWKDITVIRPDPQIIWGAQRPELWGGADMIYHRSARGGGYWEVVKKIPGNIVINYKDLKFRIKPTDFKHMGLFPEQAVNWDWLREKIAGAGREISVLNLFGYTGGATVACIAAGAAVCHVDAAKNMNNWAKENLRLSGLDEGGIRVIAEDINKFVAREIRRGRRYDGIIMDPPSYGRGPDGEVWKIDENLNGLVANCVRLLSERPLFFLINSYTAGFSPAVMGNLLRINMEDSGHKGIICSNEIGLEIKSGGSVLPCGIFGRWESCS